MKQEEKINIDWIKLRVVNLMTSPDVQQMEAHEFGAYMFILLTSFFQKKRGYIKNDEAYLRKITKLKPKAWKESKDLILSKFKLDEDGYLYNERWLSEIRDAEQYILQNKERTRLARERKYNGNDNPSKPDEWKTIHEYIEYRELEFSKLDENIQKALKVNIGIDRPIVWANRSAPVKYFDLVECILKLKDDVEWQASIMQNLSINKQKLLSLLYQFVKQIKDSKQYMKYAGYDSQDGGDNFIKHFYYWLQKNIN